ncbi:Gfo/Idh/MocA family protein [Youxingia wuxianensis]|uniref:Gfo/Idh/MocA family oxidoreductase n=1 Tax=Youxingia wuxianensis TaxID=2763678 RepID=A0A926ERP8_9FIRM|nr:Gfo/Idh/MocA family oxidoreductase [Youxingia wuxianensis]MBC8586476.1 Gfo/Idh/MocA family oxidoreductase [Youxingia wuxianensis]
MKEKKRVCIAGLGHIGKAHLEALRRLGQTEVVGISCRENAQQRAEELFVPNGFCDWREMIDTLKPDAVHVCTPNESHLEIGLYALERKIHVLCEKPLAANKRDAQRLAAAAKKAGVVHAVCFHNRFYPTIRYLRRWIASGELGEIISIHGGYLQNWLLSLEDFNWRVLSSQAGNTRVMGDIGSHWLDLAEFVTGQKIENLTVKKKQVYPARRGPDGKISPVDTQDMASVCFSLTQGGLGCGFFSQTFAGEKNRISLKIGGTKKSAEWENISSDLLTIGDRQEGTRLLGRDPRQLKPVLTQGILTPGDALAASHGDAFTMMFAQVYQRMDDPHVQGEFADFDDGVHSMELLLLPEE